MRPTSWPLPARIGAGAIGAWGWGLAYVMRVGPCQGTAGVPCGAPNRRAVSSVHKGCAPWTGTYRGRGWAAMNARAPRLTCANGRRDVAGGPAPGRSLTEPRVPACTRVRAWPGPTPLRRLHPAVGSPTQRPTPSMRPAMRGRKFERPLVEHPGQTRLQVPKPPGPTPEARLCPGVGSPTRRRTLLKRPASPGWTSGAGAFSRGGSGDALAPPVPSDQARLPARAAAGRGRV